MNEFEKGFGIGAFEANSKGKTPEQISDAERAKQEKEGAAFDSALKDMKERGLLELASYLSSLSEDQKVKLDRGLNFFGKEIPYLKWIGADKQAELMKLLDSMDQAASSDKGKDIAEKIVDMLE